MKQKINVRLIGIAVLAVLATLICMTCVYYSLFQKQVRKDLKIQAQVLGETGAFDDVRIPAKSFDIAKQRYLIDKIDIINLRDAQSSNDNATISFIRSLQDYWINYYQLRKLTLFDFKDNNEISIDFEKLR